MTSAFMILGLPAHPLIVHGAVVGIPLAATGVLAYVARPTWRARLWWPLIITVALTWIFSILAGSTGEELQHALKRSHFIHDHAEWAGRLGVAVHILCGSAVVLLGADRWHQMRTDPLPSAVRALRSIALPLGALAAIASLVMVGIVGHLGAKAAWHNSPAASAKVQAER